MQADAIERPGGGRPKQPRMRPDHVEALRLAKWNLQPRLMRDLDETTVLEMFIDETFEAWLRSKLADDAQPEPAPKRKRATE